MENAKAERIIREIDQNIQSADSRRYNTRGSKSGKVEKPPTKAAIDRKLARSFKTADRIRKDTKKNKTKRQWDSEAFKNKQLNNPEAHFHSLYVCREKGRDGSPTFDEGGYELDYDKVMTWFEPGKVVKIDLDKEKQLEEKMRLIFFEEGGAPHPDHISPIMVTAWKARVEEDIGVPYHKIGLEEFQEWERRGFAKAKEGQYKEFDEAERNRLLDKSAGSAFRK